ncbi:MAG: hypothetical protein HY552_04015 [Elusimicrobia bacterium]|nr:hypothetical protein [Elusimicrobiota bacterium]
MAGFYRKKRRKTGPSKNEEKVQRAREALAETSAAGTLASRFPSVRALRVTLSFVSPQGAVLESSETTLKPGDPFQFEADCPGRCGSGSVDFAPQLADALGRTLAEGSFEVPCAEPLYGGGPGSCGCLARCAFSADHAPS